MSLQDSYEAQSPRSKTCLVCEWAATLDEQDQRFLRDKAADARGTDIRRLWKAARDNGLPFGETTFRKHVHKCARAGQPPRWAGWRESNGVD